MENVDTSFGCGVVSVWEENIWLDRRERACAVFTSARRRGAWGRFVEGLIRFKARMQLGPVASDDWMDSEPGKRI